MEQLSLHYETLYVDLEGDRIQQPRHAFDESEDWIDNFFEGVDVVFRHGFFLGDPLERLCANVVRRSYRWCLNSPEFQLALESRGSFSLAIIHALVSHVERVNLIAPVAWSEDCRAALWNCRLCHGEMGFDRHISFVVVPQNWRAHYAGAVPSLVCWRCRRQVRMSNFPWEVDDMRQEWESQDDGSGES